MVVDDIVVVGAKPLFMTDYIACGKVVPERIADIVRGIADGCAETGTALVGGETAEHPGLLGLDDYDVAGAATGVVEADRILGAERVPRRRRRARARLQRPALQRLLARAPHRHRRRHRSTATHAADFGTTWGEALLEPTRLYTPPLLRLIDALGDGVHALSHVTGGGIAANLARVLPAGHLGRGRPLHVVAAPGLPRARRPRRPRPRRRPRAPGTSASASSRSSRPTKADAAASALRAGRHRDLAGRRRRDGARPDGRLRAGRQGRRRRSRAPGRRLRDTRSDGAK